MSKTSFQKDDLEIPYSSEEEDAEDCGDFGEFAELDEIVDAGEALKQILCLIIDNHVKRLIDEACIPPGDSVNHHELAIDAVDLDPEPIAARLRVLVKEHFKLGPSIHNINVDLVEALSAKPFKLDPVKALLEAGADVNHRFDFDMKLETLIDATPLILLASKSEICHGSIEAARLLIERGAEIDAEDSTQHGTALAYATSNGNYELARLLMTKGANIKWKNKQGTSLFLNTAWKGHLDVCKLFVEHGADFKAKNALGQNAMMLAAERGHVDVCKFLFEEHHFPLNDVDSNGQSALILASELGHLDVVKFLLRAGANVNIASNSGDTALLLAALSGHLEISQELLRRGASVNAKNQNGITVLKAAALKTHMTDFCKILIDKGADVNDAHHITALVIAARYGHLGICRLLCEHGKADLSLTGGEQNMNPLFVAAASGNEDVLVYLLKYSAALRKTTIENIIANDRDQRDNSLTYCAAYSGQNDVAKYLIEHGGNENDLPKAHRDRETSESSI